MGADVLTMARFLRRPALSLGALSALAFVLAACSGSASDPEQTSQPSLPTQPIEGAGWRLLAVQDAGAPLDTAVATTDEQLRDLWEAAELAGVPSVTPEWDEEVALLVVPIWSAGCPVNLTGFAVHEATVTGEYSRTTGACGDDIRPRAFVAAVARTHLPEGAFTLRAQDDEVPPLITDSPTDVEVDLSATGSTIPGP